MGVIITIAIIAAVIIGVIWLMRNVPSISNTILAFVGVATFLGILVLSVNYRPELLEAILSGADVPAPDAADLLFNVKYEAVGREPSEDQKWWTLGTSNWVLAGSVINKSDKELTKLKFEVFIKYGANIIGDQAVVTQHSWKVLPGQERAFMTNSKAFKDLPATQRNPIWGVKLVEINNTSVKTDIVWSPDNPLNDENAHPTSKKVKTIEIIPK
jgi:hypothetical protein